MKFDLLLSYSTNLAVYISSKRANPTTKSKITLKDIMNMKMEMAKLESELLQPAKPKTGKI